MANFRKARTFILNGERYHFNVGELNAPVIVICYNQAKQFKRRGKAIEFFAQGMNACDPMSNEFMRYATILVHLLMCKNDEIVIDRDLNHDEDRSAYLSEMLSHVQLVND